MKICFWHFYTFRMCRGIEALTVSLSNALHARGEDVSIVTASPKIDLFVKPSPGVRVFAYPTFGYFEHALIAPFYFNHFRKHDYDRVVVFFSDFGEGLTCQLLKPFKKLPLVLCLCYPYTRVKHRYDSFLKYGWDHEVRNVLAVSDWVAKDAKAVFKQPVSVLPTGTDPSLMKFNSETRAAMRAKYGYADTDLVLLNVAALERNKGEWRVLEAVARLKQRFPGLKYHVLGAGPFEDRLRAMTRELQIEDRVVFAGQSAEHSKCYSMADIFVMLPDAEANSLAFHESMSSELPVVVSNTPGFMENADNDSGLFVNPDDPGQIDQALSQLILNSDLRKKMGHAGRRYVLDHCTWDMVSKRFLEAVR